MNGKIMKLIGIGLLLIPLTVLLLFMFGEVFSGDISGLQHLVQAAPLLFFIFLSVKRPKASGVILVALSLALGFLYAVKAQFEPETIFAVEFLLFLPPLASGILLIAASKK
jgi:hypothetical protein